MQERRLVRREISLLEWNSTVLTSGGKASLSGRSAQCYCKKRPKFDAGGPEKLIIINNFAWPKSYDDHHSQLKSASLSGFSFDDLCHGFSHLLTYYLLLLRALLSSGLPHLQALHDTSNKVCVCACVCVCVCVCVWSINGMCQYYMCVLGGMVRLCGML